MVLPIMILTTEQALRGVPDDLRRRMVAKLLVHRPTREEAIRTMVRALDEFVVEGPKTTIPLLRKVMTHPDFRSSAHDTGFVERYFGAHPPTVSAKEAP